MKTVGALAVAVALLFTFTSNSILAGDNDGWENIASPSDYRPYSVISAGTSIRLDDMDELDVAPSFRIQYLTYQSRTFGLKAGLEYNASTKYNADYRYYTGSPDDVVKVRHFTIDAGFRGRFARSLISPYLEGGFQFHRYWTTRAGAGESRVGINFGAGTEVRLTKKISLDLNVNQTLNYISGRVYYAPVPGWRQDVIVPFGPPYGDAIYNPAELSLSLMHRI